MADADMEGGLEEVRPYIQKTWVEVAGRAGPLYKMAKPHLSGVTSHINAHLAHFEPWEVAVVSAVGTIALLKLWQGLRSLFGLAFLGLLAALFYGTMYILYQKS